MTPPISPSPPKVSMRLSGRQCYRHCMDVFVIPIRGDRYELYCEVSAGHSVDAELQGSGAFRGLKRRFALMLRAAEAYERGSVPPPVVVHSRMGRFHGWLMRWAAERIAEQRLLWRLRRETAVTVVHPRDLDFEQTMVIVRRILQRDLERHRRWFIVDGLAFVTTGLVAILPGPNLLAYFFAFRVVGRWLSLRGASQGLRRVLWNGRSSDELVELRRAVELTPDARWRRVKEVAERLRLPRLPTFLERMGFERA